MVVFRLLFCSWGNNCPGVTARRDVARVGFGLQG